MGRRGDDTRGRILRVARKLMSERGYVGTTLKDIEKETGLTRGSIYHHYASKEDMGKEILSSAKKDLLSFVDSTLSGETSLEKLENHFRQITERHASRRFVGGCIFGNSAVELSDRYESFRLFLAGVFEEWRRRIESVLREGVEKGEVRRGADPSRISKMTISAIEGAILLSRVEKERGPLQETFEAILSLLRP
ncbi:MAG: TetR/AcrR family transcriptional regulator [Deltaproteobacteria bacterium]|nr:MAG: TetR/AcrR family transcriptional regulator [Deltaproteobacteria bacterium]